MTALAARVQPYAETDRRMRADLRHYCAKLVKIQTKTGELKPFIWNEAQERLHAALQRQLDARGLVRALILKARQLGCSTYVAARKYHRTTLWLGQRAFILTHEDRATQQIFGMLKRIHENMPVDYQPPLATSNANELAFAGMESSYRVGTAHNTKGGGRALTLQLFHGSEAAHWQAAEQHFAAVLQAIALLPGTEVILETTANGVGGLFYDQWILAEKGQSDFLPIFLPWMIESTYARPLEAGYEPSLEEEDYQRLYKLTDEQVCWLHYKNIELGGEPGIIGQLFRQEYPATAAEAFQTTGADSFIPAEAILRARRLEVPSQRVLPRVIGVDVARGGGDKTRILDRQGRRAGLIDEGMDTDDLVQVAHRVATVLRDNPDIRRAFIDITGLGSGVYDILRNNGFERRVSGVNFGSAAQDASRYVNRRAEMWARAKEWFQDPGGAQIPDDDEWHRHIAAPGFKWDTNSRLQLEKKEDIKKRVGFSPDAGDALALTFADILPVAEPDNRPKWAREMDNDDGGDWQVN